MPDPIPSAAVPLRAFDARVWRMLNIEWQRAPYDSGSHVSGQRFNAKGRRALYLGLDHSVAIAEFHQTVVRPGTLAAYDVRSERIVDLTDAEVRRAVGADLATLGCPWRQIIAIERAIPPTWPLMEQLIAGGADGALVPSFQIPGAHNLILWRWRRAGEAGEGAAVTLIDPAGELAS